MQKLLLIIFVLTKTVLLTAQSSNQKDSLLQVLKTAKDDTAKVNLLINYAQTLHGTGSDSCFSLAKALAQKIHDKEGMLRYYGVYSDHLALKGNPDSALSLTKESVEFAKNSNDDFAIAKTTANLGFAYAGLNDFEEAVKYIENANLLFINIGKTEYEGNLYNALQLIYNKMRQFRKGVSYGLKAIEKLTVNDKTGEIAYAYNNLALNYTELTKYDSAAFYLNKSINSLPKDDKGVIEITNYLNLGYIAFLQDNIEEMKPYAEKALAMANQKNMVEYKGLALWGLSYYYLRKKDYSMAKSLSDSALYLANEGGLSALKLKVLPTLSNIAYAMQDPKAGINYYHQYERLNDSLMNEAVVNRTLQLEKKYDTEKKETQIKVQQATIKQKNTLNYIFAISAIGLLITLGLAWLNYKNRRKIQKQRITELETEKQLTATEAVLKGEEQERTRLAKDLHDGLGGMLSGIKFSLSNMKENLVMTPDNAQAFERSIDMLDSSIKEMRRVAHNMMPEILVNYSLDNALKEFCNEIKRSGIININYQFVGNNLNNIEQIIALSVYRIVQELVNNAIKHAAAKNILVQLHNIEKERVLTITVEDDGKGLNPNSLENAEGIGWKNIRNRVELLKGKIDVSSAYEKGTSVLIELEL